MAFLLSLVSILKIRIFLSIFTFYRVEFAFRTLRIGSNLHYPCNFLPTYGDTNLTCFRHIPLNEVNHYQATVTSLEDTRETHYSEM